MHRLIRLVATLLFVVLLGLSAAGLLYEIPTDIPPGVAGRHVVVDGTPLRVLQEGSGRDILMIHGSPGVLEDFDLQAAALRDSFRVTRYDRPGHGFSGDSGQYSYADNARTAAALIDKLGLEHVVVVGHSYGGTTALVLATMAPKVAAVVVLDSALYSQVRPVNPMFRFIRLPVIGTGLARVVPADRREARVAETLRAEFKVAPPPQEHFSLRVPVFASPKVLHATANEHSGLADELARLSPQFAGIRVSVHLVAQADDSARREQAERLHRELPGGELLLVSPSGHFVQFEQAQRVTALIQRAAEKD